MSGFNYEVKHVKDRVTYLVPLQRVFSRERLAATPVAQIRFLPRMRLSVTLKIMLSIE